MQMEILLNIVLETLLFLGNFRDPPDTFPVPSESFGVLQSSPLKGSIQVLEASLTPKHTTTTQLSLGSLHRKATIAVLWDKVPVARHESNSPWL